MPSAEVIKFAYAAEPAAAESESRPVKATELATLVEPGVTLVIVTLLTTFSFAKMLACRVVMNCTQRPSSRTRDCLGLSKKPQNMSSKATTDTCLPNADVLMSSRVDVVCNNCRMNGETEMSFFHKHCRECFGSCRRFEVFQQSCQFQQGPKVYILA